MVTLAIALLLLVPPSGVSEAGEPQGQAVRVLVGLPEASPGADVAAFADAVKAVLRSGSSLIRLAEVGDTEVITVRILEYGPVEGGGVGAFAATTAVSAGGSYHLERLTAGPGSADMRDQAIGYVALLVQSVHGMTQRSPQ